VGAGSGLGLEQPAMRASGSTGNEGSNVHGETRAKGLRPHVDEEVVDVCQQDTRPHDAVDLARP
jgi:hypothetical protein